MNVRSVRFVLAAVVLGVCAGCAAIPAGPPPDVVRLQRELDRLHADPRIIDNAGNELGNADAAVDTLAHNTDVLDQRAYDQGVYVAGKLVQIAEASALARYAERRGEALGMERDRLLAQARTRAPAGATAMRATGELPPAQAELFAMQNRLGGVESRVDERGLIVRLGDFMFEPGRAALTRSGEQALDSLARALIERPRTTARIEEIDLSGADAPLLRATAVRNYLSARGVALARLDMADRYAARPPAAGSEETHVDVVVRND
jgi:outer membrane protein OmpA-like peptidoglycan-associated protein